VPSVKETVPPRPLRGKRTPVVTTTLSAVAIALVFVSSFSFQLPIPATGGYFNFGDIAIFIFALTFGPVIGGISGSIGSALSDLFGGFGSFAPFTFMIKGLEGLLAGLISHRRLGSRNLIAWTIRSVLGWIIGSVAMVGGYFLAESYFIALVFGSSDLTGIAAASVELPFNILQVAAGGIVGIPISLALRYALTGTPYYHSIIGTVGTRGRKASEPKV
jgi:uncharacterized membrane protein